MVFTTQYGCLFCATIHSTKDTINQHLDSHLSEFRRSRPVPSPADQATHPKDIIRAVRSLVRRGRPGERRILPPPVPGARLRNECSGWNLVVSLNSWAEKRAHIALDRTGLDNAFWTRFVDAGLVLSGGSDPRVGTGWEELVAAEDERRRAGEVLERRALVEQEEREAMEEDQRRMAEREIWDDADWEEDPGSDGGGEEEEEQGPEDHEKGPAEEIHEDQAVEQDQENQVVEEDQEDQVDNELDRILHRVAEVEDNLSAVPANQEPKPVSPNPHAAEPLRETRSCHPAPIGTKGKGIATPEDPPPPGYGLYPLPDHLSCDPESYYRDAPSSSSAGQLNNTLSSAHHHDNGGSSLACNNGPVSFHGAASILSTRDNTIIAPQTPQRARKRVAQSPLANHRSAATPVAGTGAVDITLRLLDTGAVLPVRGRDTLDTVITSLRGLTPPGVRDALVGLHGAGPAPAWAEMEDAEWGVVWNARVWERVKRRGGAQVPLQEVVVYAEWRFE